MGPGTAPLSLRVFFDIDGTLLLTDGAGREAIRGALQAVYGTSGRLDGFWFHGKTDPQIVLELMTGAGLEAAAVRSRMASLWPVYLRKLEQELEARRAAGRIRLLPGVRELLAELGRRQDARLGLLTGNIEGGALLKLRAAGVNSAFDVGGYGSDAEERTEIARIALERSRALDGASRPRLVVVGDTPDDIACARAVGAYAVAVATGRHDSEALRAAGADAVFADFSETDAVLDCITGAGNGSLRGEGGGGKR